MKKIFIIALLIALTAPPAMAAVSVVGSKHDMIASGHATPSGGAATEVCIFCHTPHGAQTSVTQAPLWNITPEGSADGDYSVYTSVTTDFPSTVPGINATDARLCLACHDSGVGEPVNMPNVGLLEVESTTTMDANALLGTDLSNDHPIGMDLGPNPETTDMLYDGVTSNMHTIAEIIGPLGFNEDVFFAPGNTMWCSTCHDVHDSDPDMAPFLRISNVGSALCKVCHKK